MEGIRDDDGPGQGPQTRAPVMQLDTASRRTPAFFDIVLRERSFLILLTLAFFVAGAVYPYPHLAAWVGFLFASYSAVANDSIQTIGTFIASNRSKRWWILWLFIGGIFIATTAYSWFVYDGDVSYQRLAAKGFEKTPTSFSFLQIAAPLFLLILTRLRMPVSTTFLLLSSFATTPASIGKVLGKSLSGYLLAFVLALLVWGLVMRLLRAWPRKGEAHPMWRVGQWCTTGFLWSVWLMQDAANIAVYLPRSLSGMEYAAFASIVFGGLGLLFYLGGEKVQQVVDEKSDVVDVRAATIIDLVYAGILYYFKMMSNVPMSTTWVFIGLLAGRELGMSWTRSSARGMKASIRLMAKDLAYVTIGLVISLILAFVVNESFQTKILAAFG